MIKTEEEKSDEERDEIVNNKLSQPSSYCPSDRES